MRSHAQQQGKAHGSRRMRLYNYSLLSMLFAETHVIGLIWCQDIVLVGIISIGAALWDWGIRGFLVVGAEIDYFKVSPTKQRAYLLSCYALCLVGDTLK